jgi:hypothetical protein
MHEVDDLIRKSTQVDIPPEVEGRLRGRLAEFRARLDERPAGPFFLNWAPMRLVAIAACLVVVLAAALLWAPRGSRAGQLFTAAAAQLRTSQSVAYTFVFNEEPYVGVDFAFLAPAHSRVNCSWGIEIRADGTAHKEVILLHSSRSYLVETKPTSTLADAGDVVEQLRSLPSQAEATLGEQTVGGRRLYGYRVAASTLAATFPGVKRFDLWINAESGAVDHAAITVQEKGKPEHQMYIRNIRVDAKLDPAQFDLTPPQGYSPFAQAAAQQLQVEIVHEAATDAAVVAMSGPYTQAAGALQQVEAYLRSQGTVPAGLPFGRFWSVDRWEAGYPVPAGTRVDAPFTRISLPAGLTATATLKGPWGADSDARWSAFLKAVFAQGYAPNGPATEIWLGQDGKPGAQVTRMRMSVAKAN